MIRLGCVAIYILTSFWCLYHAQKADYKLSVGIVMSGECIIFYHIRPSCISD
jgi:hypothetical protein